MTQVKRLLGVDFACLTLRQAAERIARRSAGRPFAYVTTPNADHLVRIAVDPALRSIYQGSLLCLLDSRVVLRLARLLRLDPPPVVTGSDLTALVLANHVLPGERIAIVGLSPVWVPVLMARFNLAPPVHINPPIGFEEDPLALGRIGAFLRANPTRLIFLAVGSPRQEHLAAALAKAGGITGTGLCIGASLEYLCGAQRRAPIWLQLSGLEWLWRLVLEPRRLWRRYLLDCPRIIGLLLRQRLRASGND